MLILIIRHGQSEADLLHVHEGRADYELTEKGHRQAAAMAKYVASHYRLNRIYASTLKRAAQTAVHLSDESGVPVKYDADLMEFNNGLLAGLSHEEADRLYPEVPDLPVDQAVYGQESKTAFRKRAEDMLEKILSENEEDATVAIVTHGGMINQLYGALFHIPVGNHPFFCTGDTGIHVWKITGHGNYILQANVTEHTEDDNR